MRYQQAISEFHKTLTFREKLSANPFCDNKFLLHGSKKKKVIFVTVISLKNVQKLGIAQR